MRFAVQQARADQRFSSYAGWGAPQPGRYADAAMAAVEAAAEAAASGGMGVKYAWPADAPVVLSPYLEIGPAADKQRAAMLAGIASGAEDLSRTHAPLEALLAQCAEAQRVPRLTSSACPADLTWPGQAASRPSVTCGPRSSRAWCVG